MRSASATEWLLPAGPGGVKGHAEQMDPPPSLSSYPCWLCCCFLPAGPAGFSAQLLPDTTAPLSPLLSPICTKCWHSHPALLLPSPEPHHPFLPLAQPRRSSPRAELLRGCLAPRGGTSAGTERSQPPGRGPSRRGRQVLLRERPHSAAEIQWVPGNARRSKDTDCLGDTGVQAVNDLLQLLLHAWSLEQVLLPKTAVSAQGQDQSRLPHRS